MSGCYETVKILIDRGAIVDAQTEDGSTALMTAAFSGYVDIVDLLLRNGASPDLTDNDRERALMSGSS